MSRNVYSESIIINKDINTVFSFSLDFDQYHFWSGSINSGLVTNLPVTENSQFFEEYKLRGRIQRAQGYITSLEKNKSWSFKLDLAGYSLDGVYDFDAIGENKTKVTATIAMTIDNALQMMMIFRLINHLFAKRQIEKNMKDLKKLLEK